MTRAEAVKMLVKAGLGLPKAIEVYNKLTNNGFYEIEKKEIKTWIKENC